MKRIVAILIAGLITDAAYATDSSYWFLRRAKDQAWCGYADRDAFVAAGEKIASWDYAEVNYRSTDLATIVLTRTAESGDYEVVDTYRFGGDGISLGRVETRIAPFYRITSAARIGGTRPQPLRRIGIEPKDATAARIADGPVPQLPIGRSVKSFAFLKLVSRLRSDPQREICTR